MDKVWLTAISKTGAVGVVGLIISILINKIFNAEIINLLGSERLFFVLMLLVTGLLMALVIAITMPKTAEKSSNSRNSRSPRSSPKQDKDISITYNDDSTHNGDNNF
jgi:zinc transporter ZupT